MLMNKYDFLIKKAFRQKELSDLIKDLAPINPGMWICKGYFR